MNRTSRDLQVRQHRGQIARLLDHRPGGRPDRDAELVRDDARRASSCRAPAVRRAARDRAPRRAASPPAIDTCSCSRTRSWPMYSSSDRGRSPASCWTSSSIGEALTRRSSLMRGSSPQDIAQRILEGGVRRFLERPRQSPSRPPGGCSPRFVSADNEIAAQILSGAASSGCPRSTAPPAAGGPSAPGRCARRSSCRRRECASGARRPACEIARTSSPGSIPDRTASASFGPMPLMEISRSNRSCSSAEAKP